MDVTSRRRGNSPLLRAIEILSAITVLAMWASSADAQAPENSAALSSDRLAIDYVTDNGSLADLERSMTSHYVRLWTTGQLPLQRVTDDIGLPPSQLVFGLGLLTGDVSNPSFPKELDQLLCTLNSDICKSVGRDKYAWTNGKGYTICVPDVDWSDTLRFTRTPAPTSGDVQGSLDRKFGLCSIFGSKCDQVVKQFLDTKSADGKMDVAVFAQAALKRTEPPALSCGEGKLQPASSKVTDHGREYLNRLGIDLSRRPERPNRDAERQPSAGHSSADAPSRRWAFKHLIAYLPAGGIQRVSMRTDQLALLPIALTTEPSAEPAAAVPATPKLINAEIFRQLNLRQFLQADGSLPDVEVMVFDSVVNACHAALRGAISAHECPAELEAPELTYRDAVDSDHGTHVAGLIAGRFGIGTDPRAILTTVTLVDASLLVDDAAFTMMTTAMGKAMMRGVGPRVANFSLDLHSPADVTKKVGEFIRARSMILFVASAGNNDSSLDTVCDAVPACALEAGTNNLLVVGGATLVDGKWTKSKFSRFGSKRVDILAPAEKITSSLADDSKLGTMSGSSQSAALVSGLAARLMGSPPPPNKQWWGVQVKNRLLGTARFAPGLQDISRSGIADADRALDVGQQVIYVANKVEPYRGNLIGVVSGSGKSRDDGLDFVSRQGIRIQPGLCRLYRLSRSSDKTWSIATQPVGRDSGARWEKIEFHHKLVLNTTSKKLRFQPEGQEVIDIPITDVVEFYDSFSENTAC